VIHKSLCSAGVKISNSKPWLLVLWFVQPGLAFSAEEGRSELGSSGVDIFNTAYLFQVFGSLLLVFGCIFGLIFLLKKMNGISSSQKAPVCVLGVTRIGSREKILLIEAGNQQLLVGVAAGNIRTLHTFDKPIVDNSEVSLKSTDFASLLGSTFTSGKSK
jgi:flagellar protein FliO/FliZ